MRFRSADPENAGMSTETPESAMSAIPADQPMTPETPAVAAQPTATASGGRCPWCSAPLALGAGLASCPSCGAHLTGGEDAVMPGLTQVAPVTLKKVVSAEPMRRSRLLAWISGDVVDDAPETTAPADALAPPSRDVRREILRLELEAAGITLPPDAPADEADAVDGAEPAAAAAPAAVAVADASDRESTAA